METFIYALINAAIGGVRDLAAAAMERMLWLYAIVVTVGTAIRQGWNTVISGANFWRTKIRTFGWQLYGTIWYIIWVRIPVTISTSIDAVTMWVTVFINDVEARLTAGLAILRDWIVGRVNEFLDFINQLRQYLTRRFGELWDWADRVGHLVFTLLTSPDAMAAWVFGALVRFAINYIDENADGILDLIRRRSVYYAGRIAVRIEEVLVKLL